MLGTNPADLAAALVAGGIAGHAEPPQAPRPGDAWPLWDGATRGPGNTWASSWRVVYVLGADQAAAMAEVERVGQDLVDAVAGVLYVTDVKPGNLPTQAGPLLVLELEGTTE